MYHEICQNRSDISCFFDETSFCVCESNHYRANCLGYDTTLDNCQRCLSGGKCIQGNLDDPNDFICLCSSCDQGHRCEFNMRPFGFTLDSLLVGYSRGIKLIYVLLAFLLFIAGFFNNLCSFVTFKRPLPRKFGSGNYLLIVSCLNQIALLCLLFKFIQITIQSPNVIMCKMSSYFLSLFTRSTYWLTSWITLDRLCMTVFPNSQALKNAHLALGMSAITLIILFSMHFHEVIYYKVIKHELTGAPICVTNFDTTTISTYNRTITLIHYILPFMIQVISITLIIILVARSRVKASGKRMSFGQVLHKQFRTQQELYITPIIIILAALPQTILTFSLACKQLRGWQRHTLLSACLISYAPQALGFILFVLPSTSYKEELRKTTFSKTLPKWFFKKKNNRQNNNR